MAGEPCDGGPATGTSGATVLPAPGLVFPQRPGARLAGELSSAGSRCGWCHAAQEAVPGADESVPQLSVLRASAGGSFLGRGPGFKERGGAGAGCR